MFFGFPLTLLGSLQLRGQNASARCYIAPSRYFQEVRWRGAARIEISENVCSRKRRAFFFLPLKKLLELSAPSSLHQSQRVTLSRFQELQGSTLNTIVCHCSCSTHIDDSAHVSMPFAPFDLTSTGRKSLGIGNRSYFIMST
jgi:hypothetical protein